MSELFDAYLEWLGIEPHEHPVDHYRLLGVARFETDPARIAEAADERMSAVRRHQTGPRGRMTQDLLNRLAAARLCLLNPATKQRYDDSLAAASHDARRADARIELSSGPPSSAPAPRTFELHPPTLPHSPSTLSAFNPPPATPSTPAPASFAPSPWPQTSVALSNWLTPDPHPLPPPVTTGPPVVLAPPAGRVEFGRTSPPRDAAIARDVENNGGDDDDDADSAAWRSPWLLAVMAFTVFVCGAAAMAIVSKQFGRRASEPGEEVAAQGEQRGELPEQGIAPSRPDARSAAPNGTVSRRQMYENGNGGDSSTGEPAWVNVLQEGDGGFNFTPITARLHGPNLELIAGDFDQIAGWKSRGDWCEWRFRVVRPAIFRVEVTYKLPAEASGGSYSLALDDGESTRNSDTRTSLPVGEWVTDEFFFPVKSSGEHTVALHAERIAGEQLFVLRSIRFAIGGSRSNESSGDDPASESPASPPATPSEPTDDVDDGDAAGSTP